MEKTKLEEEEYLEYTLKKFEEVIADTKLRLDSVGRMYRNDPVLFQNFTNQYKNRLRLLNKTADKPYFARLDFRDFQEDKVEECYIGKVGVFDEDNKIITVDWRAPIASMYYDSNIGDASYEAPKGIIKGELLVKRQYDIESGKLNSFQDVDTVSNDEMLKPYLGVNADSRLKNIVSTIQSEQNNIIREKMHNNIIVQGVAGSGKTTVALHRIAYLVYNNINNIKPNQYLVIGPSKFFVKYISGVLPDLDVNDVSQLTYDEIVRELINEDFELISDEEKLKNSIKDVNEMFYEKLRVSMLYKKTLDKFLKDFDKDVVPDKNFIVKGYTIISKNVISDIYNSIEGNDVINYSVLAKKNDRVILFIRKYIEDNNDVILSSIRNQFYDKIENMNRDEIVKERKNIEFVEKEIRNCCNQSLKKYFSGASPKILTLYMQFLKNIENYVELNNLDYDIKEKSKINFKNIKSKKVEFEDLGALIYLFYRIYGSGEFEKYRHAVVDEAQDFGEFNFYALKHLMPKSSFSIFGDLAQSIYQYRGVSDWNSVLNSSFNGKCDIKHLTKSYRTTTEIMDSANIITNHLGIKVAEPVIRHGVEVGYGELENISNILNELNNFILKGYKSIAIICKDEVESTYIYNYLKSQNINVNNITNSDTEYNGGICTITSYLAKGLEFDGVIISDASENRYDDSKSIDMKLLYVAMTRALHELVIFYSGNITLPLQNQAKKKVDDCVVRTRNK
ncbi:MAG: RNA polymerase recycling motor HelD [Mycoplasmatota bacterium]